MRCGRALSVHSRDNFAEGTGPIFLDNIKCAGNESSLTECRHNGFGRHDCNHSEDAGVTCCLNVRLVGGTETCSGRVEVYYKGQWGTVCDDGWGLNEAYVVCRQMGCGGAVGAHGSAYFGRGTGPILLDNVNCFRSDSSITECRHNGFGRQNCNHGQDAGVTCSDSIRLVNGTGNCDGRVEIYHDGQWGTVCGDNWDMKDAEVVCRQVGCGRALNTTHSAHFDEGNGPVLLDDVGCSGQENNLLSCSHGGLGITNCSHSEDAGVICSDNIRLVNGTGNCNGRVEIYHDGQWGTVCGDNWDMKEAEVVCRQVGCGRALNSTHSAHFGEGNGPVLLDDVGCSGQENNLISCSHRGLGMTNCSHSEDAGVICSGKILFLVSNSVKLLKNKRSFTDITSLQMSCRAPHSA
ncbi:deleted in malignant brain tumors 1 protein-like [Astyanax mexicanus]|uniref:Deleted in malignant brain tumors 1 protein-like n=1 Tax=Astyanax mexicanus TaxID=7994 RepID=A0A8T2KWZ8_ASTMX|nr:deleted in malignant brain tumors 1 protein-like [Astyanax mexicanus]